ncbi:hypothetical protein CHITON_0953 [Thermococcus chitonophagus]|uniref:Uncharacterized protein n=1 Tax=Thermococcus chitonophagus TaxID=54262 RepID=A0A160VSA5_9EURY|nr:hypothetical protein CHITON_0953 [Thermococcus chitonophagus]
MAHRILFGIFITPFRLGENVGLVLQLQKPPTIGGLKKEVKLYLRNFWRFT